MKIQLWENRLLLQKSIRIHGKIDFQDCRKAHKKLFSLPSLEATQYALN